LEVGTQLLLETRRLFGIGISVYRINFLRIYMDGWMDGWTVCGFTPRHSVTLLYKSAEYVTRHRQKI